MGKVLSLEDWMEAVPESLHKDPLWKSTYYRLAMYLYDLVWEDCKLMSKDFRGREIARQLIRSSGSVCANMEEAYGRGVGTPDHVRVLRIALGEARETQGWYFRSHRMLPKELLDHRLEIANQVISLLVRVISKQRKPSSA